jgi:hypothetical protein
MADEPFGRLGGLGFGGRVREHSNGGTFGRNHEESISPMRGVGIIGRRPRRETGNWHGWQGARPIKGQVGLAAVLALVGVVLISTFGCQARKASPPASVGAGQSGRPVETRLMRIVPAAIPQQIADGGIAIINEDDTDVRHQRSLAAQVVRKLRANDLVNVYEEAGSEQVIGTAWDYWYRISPTEKTSEWINALSADLFPLAWLPPQKRVRLYRLDQKGVPQPDEMASAGDFLSMMIVDRSTQATEGIESKAREFWWQLDRQPPSKLGGAWVYGGDVRPLVGVAARALKVAMDPFGIDPWSVRMQLEGRLGAALTVEEVSAAESRYSAGAKDYVRMYGFAGGLSVQLSEWANKTSLVSKAKATEPATYVRYGVRVGTPVEAVRNILGPPAASTPNSLSYHYLSYTMSYITRFSVKDGIVVGVEWDPEFLR